MKSDNLNEILNDISRLRWSCRRGMLELDVLLGNFLNEAYSNLERDDQKRFILLINCTDPELFTWLMGKEVPADADLARIVEIIRHHAHNRF